jgi:hypothetical protein
MEGLPSVIGMMRGRGRIDRHPTHRIAYGGRD